MPLNGMLRIMHGDNLAVWCFSKCRECNTLWEWVPSMWKDGARLSAQLQPAPPPPVSILNCKLWWMWTCYFKRAPLFFSPSPSNEITWLTSSLMWKKWNPLVDWWLIKTWRVKDGTASQWALCCAVESLNFLHAILSLSLLLALFV